MVIKKVVATVAIASAMAGSIQANLVQAMEGGQRPGQDWHLNEGWHPGEGWIRTGENEFENHRDYIFVTVINNSGAPKEFDLDPAGIRGVVLEDGDGKTVEIPITGDHNSVPHVYIIKPDGNRYAIEVEEDMSYTYNELVQKQGELAPQ